MGPNVFALTLEINVYLGNSLMGRIVSISQAHAQMVPNGMVHIVHLILIVQ